MILFHRFLIGTAILFSAGFAIWSFVSFQRQGGTLLLFLGFFFAVATLGLSYYLKNLRRFLGL
jgi:hypothetical protein